MKLHRFIANVTLRAGSIVVLEPELAHQLRDVLRLKPGDEMILGDGRGNEAICRVVSYEQDSVKLMVNEVTENALEPSIDVYLYPSVLKKENLELVAQKATEIGVKVIIPVISARTVKLNVRSERMAKIVREAAEQSGRALVPTFHEPIELEKAFEHARGNDLNIFFDPGGELFDVRTTIPKTARRIGVFIGPEGGWEAGEVESARQYGCIITSLGKLILRAETAAVIAAYLAAQEQTP